MSPFEEHRPNKNNNKMSSNMGSVPDLKIITISIKISLSHSHVIPNVWTKTIHA